MNKRGFRTFAMGIIFAVSILGIYYYYFAKINPLADDVNNAKTILQKNGYVVLTTANYKKLAKMQTDKRNSSQGIHSANTDKNDLRPDQSQKK